MKEYEPPNTPFAFDEMLDAFREAVKYSLVVEDKENIGDIPWNGPEITHYSLLACGFNVEASLSEEIREYHAERGRSTLDVILGCAIRLGIEQGRRMCQSEIDALQSLLDIAESDRLRKE